MFLLNQILQAEGRGGRKRVSDRERFGRRRGFPERPSHRRERTDGAGGRVGPHEPDRPRYRHGPRTDRRREDVQRETVREARTRGGAQQTGGGSGVAGLHVTGRSALHSDGDTAETTHQTW